MNKKQIIHFIVLALFSIVIIGCTNNDETPYELGRKCAEDVINKCGLDSEGGVTNGDCTLNVMSKYVIKKRKLSDEQQSEFDKGMKARMDEYRSTH